MENKVNIIYGKINSIFDKYYSKNLLFIMLFFVAILASFKIVLIDIFAIIILSIIILYLKPEDVFCSYIFLFFFEPVTELSILGGSINRVVLLLGLAKVLYYSYKSKVKLQKESIFITLFLSFFLVFSVFISKSNYIENIVLYVNFLFFVLYSNYLSSYRASRKKQIVSELLHTIVCGVFFSIIYGLLFWNFDLEKRAGFTNWRFNGTNDPNFLAYYINLAVIVQIFRKKSNLKKDKIMNIIINVFLLIGLILSKSITGIFINTISFVVLICVKNKTTIKKYFNKNKGRIIAICSMLIIVFGSSVYILIKNNINNVHIDNSGNIVANNRIADVLLSIKNGDIDRLTSQKTRDWRLFIDDFKNSELTVKMLGKGMMPYLIYSTYSNKNVASHSTYIDFLCCFGFVGIIAIMLYLFRKLIGNIILLSNINNKVYRYVRIILLVYALELGIYTNRIFLSMFIL